MLNGMIQAFHEGGWGMYPTLFFGTWSVAIALRYAMKPTTGTGGLLGLVLTTVCSGLLGTFTGLIRTLGAAAQHPIEKAMKFIIIGTSETLHNVTLALVLVTIVCLAFAVGSYRRGPTSSPA